ncbi:MAG TPA: 30S ribosomal protein S16 [Phycisphaerae bacterium]|jgi:small subunit ribosomal protein S16|nr:30S ribosomal protein S16 [Phycisphaerae bacterium]HRT40636.1 30S ribosomal protein S16 [Phycisphaerae bacterium]
MAVKLRLKRFGRSHRSVFRLAAMESRNQRDGRVLEELGHYDPANRNTDMQVRLDTDRIKHWLSQGAQPTETVANLLKRHGVTK